MKRYVDIHNPERYLGYRTSWPAYRHAKEYARNGHGQGHDLKRQLAILNRQIAKYWHDYQKAPIHIQPKYFGRLKKLSKRAQNVALKLYENGEMNYNELHAYLQAVNY